MKRVLLALALAWGIVSATTWAAPGSITRPVRVRLFGPYATVTAAQIEAREWRSRGFRAEVFGERLSWYVRVVG